MSKRQTNVVHPTTGPQCPKHKVALRTRTSQKKMGRAYCYLCAQKKHHGRSN